MRAGVRRLQRGARLIVDPPSWNHEHSLGDAALLEHHKALEAYAALRPCEYDLLLVQTSSQGITVSARSRRNITSPTWTLSWPGSRKLTNRAPRTMMSPIPTPRAAWASKPERSGPGRSRLSEEVELGHALSFEHSARVLEGGMGFLAQFAC